MAGHDSTNVLHLGESNTAPVDQETEVNTDVEGFGFRVDNSGASGTDAASGAIQGHSDSGVAGRFTTNSGESLHCDGRAFIFMDVEGDTLTVGNQHATGDGISASANGHHAVEGVHLSSDPQDGSAGVVGVSGEGEDYGEGPGTGVLGASGTGVGIAGFSPGTGTAVRGHSVEGTGVQATSDEGLALHVTGKAAFSTAGGGEVPVGQSSTFVAEPSIEGSSHVSVTLTSDPGRSQVGWVERDPGNGFTVHLTDNAKKGNRPPISFTYLAVQTGGF